MSDVDRARMRRLSRAVATTLEQVPKDSAQGLLPTYNALRQQVRDAVPEGLRSELDAIAPEMQSGGMAGAGALVKAARDGAAAYAHLAALKGWLEAVLDLKE